MHLKGKEMNYVFSILLIAAMMMFAGCDNGNDHQSNDTNQPVQPAPAPPPQEPTPPEEEGPTMVTGSIRPHFDAQGGYVTIQASWRTNGNINPDSLVISHSENGEIRDEITPSVFGNGSLSKIDEQIYIYPNERDKPITHIFKLTYFTTDDVGRSQTWSLTQQPEEVEGNVTMSQKVIF